MEEIIRFLDKNTDAWEIYCESGWSKAVTIEKGKIKLMDGSIGDGYAVRVIVNGKVGFATSSQLSIDTCEKAIKIAKISEERLKEFPTGKISEVEGIYDKKIEDVTSEWLFEKATALINSAKEFGDVNPAQGSVKVSSDSVRLVNSYGVDLEYRSTFCGAFLEVVVKESSAFEFDQSRTLNIDVEFVGRRSAELAMESLKSEKIEKGVYDVVLSPIAVHELLSYALYPAFFAENVLKGRSVLTEVGKNYIGKLTIIDDGKIPYGLVSMPFDDEGVEAKQTVIFEDGVLKSYISDFRHALEMGIEPTGNGLRGRDLYPATSPTNVVLEFEEESKDIYDNALVVHALIGAHTSNPISGDFSLECMNAFLVKNGERKAVKSAMIYGNIYELLKSIEVFGKDVRQIENTIAPSIRFRDVVVNV